MLISVKRAAEFLGVSERRIRALLQQGRIRGIKAVPGLTEGATRTEWLVEWPLDVRPGTRGPDLKRFPVRGVFSSPPPASRARQGSGQKKRKK
jgi:excisionase family DNA binding protein